MKSTKLLTMAMLILLPAIATAYTPGSKPLRGTAKVLETGIEGPFHGFYLGKDLNGHVKTKFCETELNCKEITYKITPDVKATLDGTEVPLSQFVMSSQQPSVVHINNDTGKPGRISWVTPKKSRK